MPELSQSAKLDLVSRGTIASNRSALGLLNLLSSSVFRGTEGDYNHALSSFRLVLKKHPSVKNRVTHARMHTALI